MLAVYPKFCLFFGKFYLFCKMVKDQFVSREYRTPSLHRQHAMDRIELCRLKMNEPRKILGRA